MKVHDAKRGNWLLTAYYGFPERQRRRVSWDLLRSIAVSSPVPWCCIGDYYDLLCQDEKKSVVEHPQWLCCGFKEAIFYCMATSLRLLRSKGKPECVEEWLDKAMVVFPMRAFRFENKWLLKPGLSDIVESSWSSSVDANMVSRLRMCSSSLDEWGRELAKRFYKEIDACRRHLEVLHCRDDPTFVSQFNEAKSRQLTLLAQEEAHWRQHAKKFWLREGDMNSHYFHSAAN
ncbi:hypothetical protein PTKIN_Ptkin01aG0271000 [Pterospermum kingtungense]